MKVKSESEVTQSCPTLRNPMDCSPPGPSIYGIFQAKVLEWGAIAFSEGSPGELKKKKKKVDIWPPALPGDYDVLGMGCGLVCKSL